MPVTVKRFDAKKAIEALTYIASKTPQPGFHNISKMFYFADKLHLERFGSMISNDVYIAMENGPVPSRIYDFMKFAAGRSVSASNAIPAVREAISAKGYMVSPMRKANSEYLSKSELACIDEAIAKHGRKSFGQLSDESHDSAWGSVEQDAPIPFTEIVKTLPSADKLLEYYRS